jgi:hypothetical protein
MVEPVKAKKKKKVKKGSKKGKAVSEVEMSSNVKGTPIPAVNAGDAGA